MVDGSASGNKVSRNAEFEPDTNWDSLAAMADKMDDGHEKEDASRERYISQEELSARYRNNKPLRPREQIIWYANPLFLERCMKLEQEHGSNYYGLIHNVSARLDQETLYDYGELESAEGWSPDKWRIGKHAEVFDRFSDETLAGLGQMFRNVGAPLFETTNFVFNRSNEAMEKVIEKYHIADQILYPDGHMNQSKDQSGNFFTNIRDRLNKMFRFRELILSNNTIDEDNYDRDASLFLNYMLSNVDLSEVDDASVTKISELAREIAISNSRFWRDRSEDRVTINDLVRHMISDRENGRSVSNTVSYCEFLQEITQGASADQSAYRAKKDWLWRVNSIRGMNPRDVAYLKDEIFPILDGCSANICGSVSDVLLASVSTWHSLNDNLDESVVTSDYEYTNYVIKNVLPDLYDAGILESRSTTGRGQVFVTVDTVQREGKLSLVQELLRDRDYGPFNAEVFDSRFDKMRTKMFPMIDQCKFPQICRSVNFELTSFLTSSSDRLDDDSDLENHLDYIQRDLLDLLNTVSSTWFTKSSLMNYAKKDKKLIDYYRNNLFPEIDSKPEIAQNLDNLSGLRGGNNIRDFELACLAGQVLPRDVNLLIMERRELTTDNLEKLSRNRIDALAIENVVIDRHNFIHGESPMTNRLLSTMVEYYDAQGKPDFLQAEARLNNIIAECMNTGSPEFGNELAEKALNLKNYDRMIKGDVRDDHHVEFYDEPAISILRRLVTNTDKSKIEIPVVDDLELQKLITNVNLRYDADRDTTTVDWNGVGKFVNYLNVQLISRQGEFGLDRSEVDILSFADQMAAYAMRSVSESERRELPFDPVFKELVRFQRLTAAFDSYNHEEFENFYDRFSSFNLEDERDLHEHYVMLQEYILKQVNKLAHYYNTTKRRTFGNYRTNQTYSRYVPELLSGNLGHELIGLIDSRPNNATMRDRADNYLQNIRAY